MRTDDSDEPRDQTGAICDAVEELSQAGPGDILVFLSGEREIRDTADALRKQHLRDTEILPLYARLSAAEQHRVFQPHRWPPDRARHQRRRDQPDRAGHPVRRRSGNGTHLRYSSRLKVQRLPIEQSVRPAPTSEQDAAAASPTASASACTPRRTSPHGRSSPIPEILRTNLASVILQMTALDLGEIAAFPFVEPPDRRQVRDGYDLLHELGALEPERDPARQRFTTIGWSTGATPQ